MKMERYKSNWDDNGEEVDDFDGWKFKAVESVMPTAMCVYN